MTSLFVLAAGAVAQLSQTSVHTGAAASHLEVALGCWGRARHPRLYCQSSLCDVPHCMTDTPRALMFYSVFSSKVNRSQPPPAERAGQVCLTLHMFSLKLCESYTISPLRGLALEVHCLTFFFFCFFSQLKDPNDVAVQTTQRYAAWNRETDFAMCAEGAEKKKKSEQSVPIYSCFYLTMHAGHDPIHIEEYRFVFAFKYFLTLISYIYLPLPFSGSPLQIISAHSEWKNCMHSKGH